jgi:hypothetical protein
MVTKIKKILINPIKWHALIGGSLKFLEYAFKSAAIKYKSMLFT